MKKDLILQLFDLVIAEERFVRLQAGENHLILSPQSRKGVEFPRGVSVTRVTPYGETNRLFYFPETMREEFFRHINRHVGKRELELTLHRLHNTPDGDMAA
jgi:hypothetical protein